MVLGVNLLLKDGATAQANLTGIQALWWDVIEPKDAKTPVGKASNVTTDASGYINLDLSNVSGLTVGDYGFLTLYKLDATNHEDSLIFSGKVLTSTISSGTDMQSTAKTWVRDPSWLTLPSVDGLQKLVGLHAVFPDSNFLALTASGNYTVDWGDGTATEDIAANVTAQHSYAYSASGITDTEAPVTLQDAGNTVTRTAHGYSNGMRVKLYNIVTTTGVVSEQTYYVINSTVNTFQLSATLEGAPLELVTDGTASLLNYRQAIVTLVPQAGQTLTAVNLHKKHTQSGLMVYCSGFLDIALSGSNLSSLLIADRIAGAGLQDFRLNLLQQVKLVGANLITNFSSLFYNCYALQSVPLLNTAAGISFSYMFSSCYALQSVPLLNTAAGTNFSYMFNGCYALQSVPLLNTAAGTDFSSMFSSCYALQSVPLLNTAAGTNFSYMFNGARSLQSVPLLNTAAGITFSNMFNSCYALQSVPLLNTAAGTNCSNMFNSCYALQSVPLLNTAAGTNFSYMFFNCYALQSVPLLNTAAGISFTYMFSSCTILPSVPLLNTAAGTNFSNMFSGCLTLQSVPLLNTAAGTDFSSMFSNCPSLASGSLAGTKLSISYVSCKLSAAALDSIYTNLFGPVTAKTITVTSNWGNVSDTPSIATAKGWTVTG